MSSYCRDSLSFLMLTPHRNKLYSEKTIGKKKNKAPKVMLQRSKINTTNVPREMEISLRGECSYST